MAASIPRLGPVDKLWIPPEIIPRIAAVEYPIKGWRWAKQLFAGGQ